MKYRFKEEIKVRFADLDAYGHVNNATFFTYLETARTNTFLSTFNNLMEKGILLIVVKTECSYLKPITLIDRVFVEFGITSKGKTSFVIDYEINNGKSVTFATASTTMVCLDKNSGKTVKVPGELEEYLFD
ncbi:4-hydroxybenzoyl-CoA thioesterase [Flexistipes sinusarabici DSM 4947]|uniref:4-hydroxybenzoyl-CoA thioesterase n=1 Tax=Flexistipes sinusarabici (strain ATCC 49648 / DSM 4947 / MAS 10) TaxID=717231 RepID=F8E8W4_FLESM|nr:thioesterase family protein [Flexistipes sinusarabici]AEI14088.1 4-hydroxybenzoyl-CoA thioesterase [Flexistipes sinusarabici DSM 4947]